MNQQATTVPLMSIGTLLESYAHHAFTPIDCVAEVLRRIEVADRPEAWTHRVPAADLRARANALQSLLAEEGDALLGRMPLFGVPFAVKDNIDVAGIPTTAACPEFAYVPHSSAFAVQRLLDAGAILVGKTNLDQFATGLVGTRSPYGAVRQTTSARHVSGGSSSGSAVAVAAGCVAFSLGTDTAGSGRVPAGFNGLVGMKPSLGLVSTRGVVPACRTLDTISVFAHDVADAWRVMAQLAAPDELDGYSRRIEALGLPRGAMRVGVPDTLEFEGDLHAERAFAAALDGVATGLSIFPTSVDFQPMQQTSALLYDGPWVAERRAAVGAFFDTHRFAMDPVVAAVISKADQYSAVDAFNGQYRLAELKRQVGALFDDIDVLIVPTTPTHPTIEAVKADPIGVNSKLGRYTNFVNLLDLCALAVPCIPRADGLPAGITLIGPSGADHRLAVLGTRIQALFSKRSVAEGLEYTPLPSSEPTVTLAVVGAHLRGQPLNWQLREAGARYVATTTTAPCYRLYALAGTTPPKPGLARAEDGEGAAIELELWELPLRLFGKFVTDVPAPLGVGSVELADGRRVKGFICEPIALSKESGARNITGFGGWRAYLRSPSAAAPAGPAA
ncbi:allophanate hydrolase [Cupriavidus sp. IDO]|uniref:allophanate hydrolase n=1 Tax=Cupriavidus sp. IDO TaxID=1539142 RepID=UPI003FCE2FE1